MVSMQSWDTEVNSTLCNRANCFGSCGTRMKVDDSVLFPTLDDPSEISCKDIARSTRIREYLQKSYKNGVILKVQKNLAGFLKESCKETSDLLNRQFLQEKWTNRKSLARIFQDLAFLASLARLLHFSGRIMHYLARFARNLQESCKFCLTD